jgi:hypothetical protein
MWAMADVSAVARPGSETCKTNPIWGLGPRIADWGLRIGRRRPGRAGGQMRKTNPICLRPGPAPEAKGAKRTQFGPLHTSNSPPATLTGGITCKTNPIWSGRGRTPETKCAKRTQFRPGAGGRRMELCKTKPNLGLLGYMGKGSCPVALPRREGKCAKQTQSGKMSGGDAQTVRLSLRAGPTKSAPDALGRASVPARPTEPSGPTRRGRTRTGPAGRRHVPLGGLSLAEPRRRYSHVSRLPSGHRQVASRT